jgi:hypothetical protein
LALSKLSRNAQRDREDVEFLARSLSLDPKVLRERYDREMKFALIGPPDQHDITLELWIEAYFVKG